jgi:putative transposase
MDSQISGLGAAELKRLKELEAENAKLKRLHANIGLAHSAVTDLTSKAAKEVRGCSLSSPKS